jgi:hypothetical protein
LAAILFCVLISKTALLANDNLIIDGKISFAGITYLITPQKDTIGFTVPFSRAGNLILLQASVDSIKGNFVLDTGNPELVLNLTYFRDYPKYNDPEEDVKGINGSIGQVDKILVKEFALGGIKAYNQKADLVPLGGIENAKNKKIIGLIGMRYLRDCEMVIDYATNTISFVVLSRKVAKTYKSAFTKDTSVVKVFPFETLDNRILITAQIGAKKLKFVVDCAAESNILDSRLPSTILETLTVTGQVIITGVGNKKIEALQGDLNNITVGNKNINQLPFIVTNLEKTCFSYTGCVDGVFGFDFLSLQKIGFNFVTNKMYLWQ